MKHLELPELIKRVRPGMPVEISTEDEVLKKLLHVNSNRVVVIASRHDKLLVHRSKGSNLLDSIEIFREVMKGHIGIRPPINVGEFIRSYIQHLKGFGIEVVILIDRSTVIEELTEIMALHDRNDYDVLRVQARVWIDALYENLVKEFNVMEAKRPLYA